MGLLRMLFFVIAAGTVLAQSVDSQFNNGNRNVERYQIPEITVAPNPTSGIVNIRLASPQNGLANMMVVNMVGQQVYSQNVDVIVGANQFNMDFSHFDNGVYIMLITKDGAITSNKFVISK